MSPNVALRFFLFGCLAVAVYAYQDIGHSIIISPGDAGSNGVAAKAFEHRLGREILDRILRGKAVKVSLEETRRLTYEQETECNNCNQPTQPPVTTTSTLPPGPTLTQHGNFMVVVPCSADVNQILYTGLSVSSTLPVTWHDRLQSSSDTIDINAANKFVRGPDANGNFMPASAVPVDTVYQTYEVWVIDSLGRQSTSVYVTVHPQSVSQVKAVHGQADSKIPPLQLRIPIFAKEIQINDTKRFTLWRIVEEISRVWCVTVFFILGAYWAKAIYSSVYGLRKLHFTVTDLGMIIGHLTYAGWLTQLLSIQVIFVRGCFASYDAGMFKFFISWGRLRFPCALNTCPTFSHYFIKRRNIIICIAVLHLIAQIISVTGPLFISAPEFEMFGAQLNEGVDGYKMGVNILNYCGGIVSAIVYIIPCYFFLLICYALVIEFHHLASDLENEVKGLNSSGKVTTGQTLEWYRLRHICLCELVELAENVFSPWILLVLGGGIVQMLFQVYEAYALGSSWNYLYSLTQFFWFITYALQILIVLYAGSHLHETAHSVLSHVYKIDQSKLTLAEGLQIQTFLNKLTCNQIGFTAWRMFTITNEAVLGLIAAYITHQILIFQLQLDLGLDAKVESCGALLERPGRDQLNSSSVSVAHLNVTNHSH